MEMQALAGGNPPAMPNEEDPAVQGPQSDMDGSQGGIAERSCTAATPLTSNAVNRFPPTAMASDQHLDQMAERTAEESPTTSLFDPDVDWKSVGVECLGWWYHRHPPEEVQELESHMPQECRHYLTDPLVDWSKEVNWETAKARLSAYWAGNPYHDRLMDSLPKRSIQDAIDAGLLPPSYTDKDKCTESLRAKQEEITDNLRPGFTKEMAIDCGLLGGNPHSSVPKLEANKQAASLHSSAPKLGASKQKRLCRLLAETRRVQGSSVSPNARSSSVFGIETNREALPPPV